MDCAQPRKVGIFLLYLYSMDTIFEYLQYTATLFAALIATFSGNKMLHPEVPTVGMSLKQKIYYHIKRRRFYWWLFFFFTLSSIILTCTNSDRDKNAKNVAEKKARESDSIYNQRLIDSMYRIQVLLADYGFTADLTNNVLIRKIDSISKERNGSPSIGSRYAPESGPYNGAYFSKSGNDLDIHFFICNYGSAEAAEVQVRIYIFFQPQQKRIVLFNDAVKLSHLNIGIKDCYKPYVTIKGADIPQDGDVYIMACGSCINPNNSKPHDIKLTYHYDYIKKEWANYTNYEELLKLISKEH